MMELIRQYFKVQLPKYLKGLPLPRTFAGFAKLSYDDWAYLAPFLIALGVIFSSIFFSGSSSSSKPQKNARINKKISLDKDKVVDKLKLADVEDLCKGDGSCNVCRCWKSKKFPYCDGSHVKHNKQTGDNVGPLLIQK